ncbi:MAG TPA: glutathione S-transferase N-terminal domain-containing protein [Stellaceae bacterium]|nr:glutathione S-transferase N-terminal domain-containing protein [Stellaceae bacterium]
MGEGRAQTTATLAAENPLMNIPALITDDGQALFDSPVICEYLDSLAGGGKVFPAPGSARWTALRQQALGDGTLDALILCRYEIAARPEEKRHAAWTDGQTKKAQNPIGLQARRILTAQPFPQP